MANVIPIKGTLMWTNLIKPRVSSEKEKFPLRDLIFATDEMVELFLKRQLVDTMIDITGGKDKNGVGTWVKTAKGNPSSKVVTLTGDVLAEAALTPHYKALVLVPEAEALEIINKLKGLGLNKIPRSQSSGLAVRRVKDSDELFVDENGMVHFSMLVRESQLATPPLVKDDKGEVVTKEVGNGSVGTVKVLLQKDSKQQLKPLMIGAVIHEHVVYDGSKSQAVNPSDFVEEVVIGEPTDTKQEDTDSTEDSF